MSILRYFEHKNGLLDPNGALSCTIAPGAISIASKEIEKVVRSEKKKRSFHNRFVRYEPLYD